MASWNDDRAMNRRRRRNKELSLDRDGGIERKILLVELSLDEIYERKVLMQQLYSALNQLPPVQARRIYAHFFLQMSKAEIARAEGVSKKVISVSIARGLKLLKNIFENSF